MTAARMSKVCSCHADDSLYGQLDKCPACGHRSYDSGIGCERQRCGHVRPEDACEHLSATGVDQATGPNKVWRCDSCGWLFRSVVDSAGFTRQRAAS